MRQSYAHIFMFVKEYCKMQYDLSPYRRDMINYFLQLVSCCFVYYVLFYQFHKRFDRKLPRVNLWATLKKFRSVANHIPQLMQTTRQSNVLTLKSFMIVPLIKKPAERFRDRMFRMLQVVCHVQCRLYCNFLYLMKFLRPALEVTAIAADFTFRKQENLR